VAFRRCGREASPVAEGFARTPEPLCPGTGRFTGEPWRVWVSSPTWPERTNLLSMPLGEDPSWVFKLYPGNVLGIPEQWAGGRRINWSRSCQTLSPSVRFVLGVVRQCVMSSFVYRLHWFGVGGCFCSPLSIAGYYPMYLLVR